jgi:RNA ligase (TIGR02306 family)
MSTHGVYVVRIPQIKKHEYADTLGLVEIQGYTCIVRLVDFAEGDLAIYVEPDYVLPGNDHPHSALWDYLPTDERRIKVRKFRGIYSQGLLMKLGALKDSVKEGDDVMSLLGITRFDQFAELGDGAERPIDSLAHLSAYDMESYRGGPRKTDRKWSDLFQPGERVIVTEKVNGESARYTYREGRMWVGSRTAWRAPLTDADLLQGKTSIFWDALRYNPWIEPWCVANQDKILYGEVVRGSKKMHYGLDKEKVGFFVFDVYLGDRRWEDAEKVFGPRDSEYGNLTCTPVVYDGPFSREAIEPLAEADSVLSIGKALKPHYAEGVVIKPAKERTSVELGRLLLKLVGNRYLEKA